MINANSLNYIQSILSEIRVHSQELLMHLDTFGREEIQRERDQLSILSSQLADMYGDLEEEFHNADAFYVKRLREEHLRLWEIYQLDDPLLNPGGKLSKSVAQDKARYQSVIEVYPLTGELNKIRGLMARANGLWRYTLPKVLDSIASRIAIMDKYPEGVPDNARRISKRHQNTFDEVFGDLDNETSKAVDALAEILNEYTGTQEYTNSEAFNDSTL